LIHIVMRFFFQLFWLSTKCQEQSNILEKQNGKRVCVKDEWKCLLLLYITISLFCLSKCKTNVVTKLVFENSCHTLVRWWCKGIYKILTIGIKRRKKSYYNVKIEDTVCPNFSQKKAVLQNYLIQHNIPFSATDTKKVLYEKIKQKRPR
jgi:hypothetical protein